MGASSKGAPEPKTDPAPRRTSPAPVSWSARGNMRGRARLKLLGSLRGAGALVWSGGVIPAAYELDVFAGGETRSASGNLEGDLSALPTQAPDAPDATLLSGVRLRLADGRELAVDLVSLEADFAEFEARLTAADTDLVPAPTMARGR
jgi:hypothetical protein